jgi:hypothetical protein
MMNFEKTAIGWNSGCVVFYGYAVEILFCILYTYFAPYEGEQGSGL